MPDVFLLDLPIDDQGHVFPIAASPVVFLAEFDVGLVGRKGFGSASAVIDRANVANDDFVGGHEVKLRVIPASGSFVSLWLRA
jgi:hypothetical protein